MGPNMIDRKHSDVRVTLRNVGTKNMNTHQSGAADFTIAICSMWRKKCATNQFICEFSFCFLAKKNQHKTIKLILFTCWPGPTFKNYKSNDLVCDTHRQRQTCYENVDDMPTSNPTESESCFCYEIFFMFFPLIFSVIKWNPLRNSHNILTWKPVSLSWKIVENWMKNDEFGFGTAEKYSLAWEIRYEDKLKFIFVAKTTQKKLKMIDSLKKNKGST